MLASEVAPYAKTGGLADVVGSLSKALARRGHEVHVVLPLYGSIDRGQFQVRPAGLQAAPGLGGRWEAFEVFRAGPDNGAGPTVWMLSHPLFARPGLYGERGSDYPDNHVRFRAFCHAALDLVRQRMPGPDILHLHDWQAGLAAVDLRAPGMTPNPSFAKTKIVFTIHNLAFTGAVPAEALDEMGLPRRLFAPDALEFYGRLALIKGGLSYADELTTVSPRYAREIQTPAGGYGLDGILAERHADLFGIVNGLDYSVWNPATDRLIPARYSPTRPAGKARCKRELQKELGLLADGDRPLIGMVTRLAEQKGLDILAEALPGIMALPVQFVLLGDGEERFRWAFAELAGRYPGRMAVKLGFDDRLAHRIPAASDLCLMPSRFEPCGLNQLIALKYGAVPVVRETGGLADTVTDGANGFTFSEYNAVALLVAVRRALAARAGRAAWSKLMLQGMGEDWGWGRSAGEYARLYALARARRGLPVPIAPEMGPAEAHRKPAARRPSKSTKSTKPRRRRP